MRLLRKRQRVEALRSAWGVPAFSRGGGAWWGKCLLTDSVE